MNQSSFEQLQQEVKASRKSEYPIHPMFLNRWSPRAFSSKEVDPDALMSIFEAACWAPSGGNLQPWRYIIARNEQDKLKFKSFINEGNWNWCQHAPVLALLTVQTTRGDNKPNRTAMLDAGASWACLALEAMHQGLITHAMGGFQPDLAKEVLDIPDDYECCIVIAIGYRGDKDQLAEKDRSREFPSTRRPFKQSLYEGKFGQAIDL